MHDLAMGRDGFGFALAINSKNQVVGQWVTTTASNQQIGVFLYEDGNLYDLQQLLDSSGDSWTYFIEASGINSSGQIVGSGVKQDGVHAFRMDPVRVAFCPESDLLGFDFHQSRRFDRCRHDVPLERD